MALTDGLLTINEALEYARLQGQKTSEVYLRVLIGTGRIPSRKIMGRRLVDRDDIAKWLRKRAVK